MLRYSNFNVSPVGIDIYYYRCITFYKNNVANLFAHHCNSAHFSASRDSLSCNYEKNLGLNIFHKVSSVVRELSNHFLKLKYNKSLSITINNLV